MYLPVVSPAISLYSGVWFTSDLDNNHSVGLASSTPVLFSFNQATPNIRYSENNFANNPFLASPGATIGVWQDWKLVTDLDAGMSTISVDGVTSTQFPHNSASNAANGLVFQGAFEGGADYYVDDVRISYIPEPATLGLASMMLSLLAVRRRRA
jgi:hypothetical protein